MSETSNKIVSMVFYPVVYETDTNGDEIISKTQDKVSSGDNYSFVTVKEILNHGEYRFVGIRLS